MKKVSILLLAMACCYTAQAQEESEKKNYGITFSGFVKNDFFLDTRQTVSSREGHFLLWPDTENLDANHKDINTGYNLNMLAIQSRLTGKITGPDAFGAKTSGVIEGDFFAQANDNINLFRLRHAFLKLNWSHAEVLTGQYWNPLFVTECFPGTVSFNTGAPLQSFARNPQIRVSYKTGGLQLTGAVLSQRDYASKGSNGTSSEYLRNSALPDVHAQIQYKIENADAGTLYLIGAGIAYKTIVPRLSSKVTITPAMDTILIDLSDTTATHTVTKASEATYRVDESVGGLSAIVFTTIKLKPFTVKMQYRYGENLADVLSISGFAVKQVEDATTGELSYTPLINHTIWADLQTNGEKLQVGIFGGYLLNAGTKSAMSSSKNAVYGLGTNIESLLRISPRIQYNSGKVRIAFELEYTQANYGSDYDTHYKPGETTSVSNYRALLSTYCFF